MRFTPTPIAGVMRIQAEPVADERGHFARHFCPDEFAAAGIAMRPLQWSSSWNRAARTLRGMHWQAAPHGEAKLVRPTRGRLFDVALDLRPGSSTLGRWFGAELDARAGDALFIPAGLAHGFITLEDDTEVLYATDAPYHAASARGARWDDPAFGIAWPVAPVVISERDRGWPDWQAPGSGPGRAGRNGAAT